jgi:hypothetical protein
VLTKEQNGIKGTALLNELLEKQTFEVNNYINYRYQFSLTTNIGDFANMFKMGPNHTSRGGGNPGDSPFQEIS